MGCVCHERELIGDTTLKWMNISKRILCKKKLKCYEFQSQAIENLIKLSMNDLSKIEFLFFFAHLCYYVRPLNFTNKSEPVSPSITTAKKSDFFARDLFFSQQLKWFQFHCIIVNKTIWTGFSFVFNRRQKGILINCWLLVCQTRNIYEEPVFGDRHIHI